MDPEKQTHQEEQQRVNRVVQEIDQRISTLQSKVLDAKDELIDIRKNFWDDVTVNLEDSTEAAETFASMKQHAELLAERERTHQHADQQLKTFNKLKNSPYFGRIDFKETGTNEEEQVYLGISSLLDAKEEQYLIYDWRAPISSLYYDFSPGPVQYQTPAGTIEGTMELKRQYVIRQGHIRSLFDTGVTIGDELLQEVLGQQSDASMKSIVATIQQEQNQIIRDERSKLLIVQGAAGSGKTSAALQRVAYLLYRYRGTLRSEQVILFSPNPMFNSYVSTVLPELGEENMQQTTFQQYLESQLSRTFNIEDPYDQMEYTLTAMNEAGYEARLAGIRYKTSTDFMVFMEYYVLQLQQRGLRFKPLKLRGKTIIAADKIEALFYGYDPSISIPNRMTQVAESLLKELTHLAKLERSKPWVDEAIELLDPETYMEVYERMREKHYFTDQSFQDFKKERELLAIHIVQEQFKKLRRQIKRLRFIDIPAIYRQLFADSQWIDSSSDAINHERPMHWDEICAQTVHQLDGKRLAYEDATPFLYLKELLEGFQSNTSIRHVFIDEAQDYSPFQFSFLKRLFPFAKFTALGDLNQTIYAHASDHSGFAPLRALFEPEHTNTMILRRSYRSTRPIVEFTQQMIPGGEAIEPFQRDGNLPIIHQVNTTTELTTKLMAQLQQLQAEGMQTIAIIGKTASECREAYAALKSLIPVRLINSETVAFDNGVIVIPSYLSKGMEFDAVIIYNASADQYHLESERKLFYTACTRAMHELCLFAVGELSPFLSQVDPTKYTVK